MKKVKFIALFMAIFTVFGVTIPVVVRADTLSSVSSQQLLGKAQKSIGNDNSGKAAKKKKSNTTVYYMRKKDVLNTLNHINKSGKWFQYVDNPIGSGAIATATKFITKKTWVGIAAGVITWMTSTIWSSQKAWWNKSAILLLQGKIKSVKCTIVGHPGQNYPAATVSWKRVK